jgi:toxin ParE1/3/4
VKYRFHPEAENELLAAARRYQLEVPGLGRSLIDEVDRVVQLLLDNPAAGAQVDANLRHFVLRRFPFSVVYAETPDGLYIVAIAHGSREPACWQYRVQDR